MGKPVTLAQVECQGTRGASPWLCAGRRRDSAGGRIETAVQFPRDDSSVTQHTPPVWAYFVPHTLRGPFLFCTSLRVVGVHFTCRRWNLFIFSPPKFVTALLMSLQK